MPRVDSHSAARTIASRGTEARNRDRTEATGTASTVDYATSEIRVYKAVRLSRLRIRARMSDRDPERIDECPNTTLYSSRRYPSTAIEPLPIRNDALRNTQMESQNGRETRAQRVAETRDAENRKV